ncbi:MAG TPA: DUF4124 domain-containing protein [Rhodanobacteraceae bacterium]|nr:DUF4124 domain-containing protein [Rhodanobacteraceae bacterium]
MQLRTFIAASVIGLSLACASGFAGAQQIYKWKDANGVIHFSQTPPTSGMHYTKMHLAGEPEVSSTPLPASSPQDNTGQNARVAARPAASGGSQPDTPANRAELCKQLSSNITLLQSKQPVVTSGDGKQQVMSDNARESQLATARAQQVQYCSSKGA